MDTQTAHHYQALLVFDACTFNPLKNFKTTKVRLKKKLQHQLRDQPTISRLLGDLKHNDCFTITQFIPIAIQLWGHASDEQVLNKLEELAWEHPEQVVIFVTRDLGFCNDSGWKKEHSRVYVIVLPRQYFSKTIDQYSRLEMMYIIAIDVRNFFTQGSVKLSTIFSPAYSFN